MPELPEVETTRRGVAPHVVGRRIAELHVYDRRLRWPVPSDLEDTARGPHDRPRRPPRASTCSSALGADTLLVHLGMTGSLRVTRSAPPRRTHDHVDLVLDDGVTLRYHDPRRFGAMLWIAGPADAIRFCATWARSRSTRRSTPTTCGARRAARRAAIKLALMDNHVVVGVGNIYANESLFRAGIRPTTAAPTRLSRPRLARLVDEVRAVLTEAIAKGGSTLRDYVDARRRARRTSSSTTSSTAATGEPCRVCGTPIRTARQGARASFYCPRCQR